MNHIARLLYLFLTTLLLTVTSANAAVNPERAPDIIGTWTKAQALPDGRTMSARISFVRDNTFNGVVSIGQHPYWTYAGKWQIEGRALTYHYQQSSVPLGEADKTDVDDIVSVGGSSLVVRSRKTGAEHIFLRAE